MLTFNTNFATVYIFYFNELFSSNVSRHKATGYIAT